MNTPLTLTLTCSSKIKRFETVKISEINGETYIWSENVSNDQYDAFEHPELMPELIKMVKMARRGKDRMELAENWVKKWGFLQEEQLEKGYGQKLSSFWKHGIWFTCATEAYIHVTNKDEVALAMMFSEIGLDYYSEDNLRNYQWNGMGAIVTDIIRHTMNGYLAVEEIRCDDYGAREDFTIKPTYYLPDLIGAIYTQFYTALTENKKICPVCDTPFTPMRKDKKYCSDSCKNTARSQRYRTRKAGTIIH